MSGGISYEERYPVELIETALGPESVAELRQAVPEDPQDSRFMRDRFIINPGALGYWLYYHLGFNVFACTDENGNDLIVDPLGEVMTVEGKPYKIPHWCYLNTGLEPGDDRRPTHWRGIPQTPPVPAEQLRLPGLME